MKIGFYFNFFNQKGVFPQTFVYLCTRNSINIDRDLLTKVMRCIVNDEDYSESVKLELMEAMSQDIGFSDDE